MAKDTDNDPTPRHVAIIMDGNGRWAKARGRPRLFGHHAGAHRVREIGESCPRVTTPPAAADNGFKISIARARLASRLI